MIEFRTLSNDHPVHAARGAANVRCQHFIQIGATKASSSSQTGGMRYQAAFSRSIRKSMKTRTFAGNSLVSVKA
jgi:hypothetical protein